MHAYREGAVQYVDPNVVTTCFIDRLTMPRDRDILGHVRGNLGSRRGR